jgi:hypothetical protein
MTAQSITKPSAAPQAAAAVIGQAGPSARAGALRPAHRLRARFRGVGARERWGYGVWLFVGLVFGVPESWAGITNPPWPALSDTVGHLEDRPGAQAVPAILGRERTSPRDQPERRTPARSPNPARRGRNGGFGRGRQGATESGCSIRPRHFEAMAMSGGDGRSSPVTDSGSPCPLEPRNARKHRRDRRVAVTDVSRSVSRAVTSRSRTASRLTRASTRPA